MFREENEQLNQLSAKLEELRRYLDLDAKREKIEELEAEISEPDFWNQQENAQKRLKERNKIERVVESWEQAYQNYEDAQILVELGEDAQDESVRAEVQNLLTKAQDQVARIEFARMLSGTHDDSNAIFSINAGAGGTEAQDWAEMLLRMYLRFCEQKGFKTEITDYQTGDDAGIKGVTFTVEGDYAYGWLRSEMGIHRLVRISPFDAASKRHTSFCSVFVFPDLDDSIEIEINENDLKIDTYRASGAGGQHVNKTDSAIRITHIPTGIVVACQSQRSQLNNKAEAMRQLKGRLYEMEEQKQEEEASAISGEKKEIGWGSQIRSYVLHPYRMVKDHRTGYEVGNTDAVLDGDIEGFIEHYLMAD
ncbi:MAG: peptide chain release factor 2 [Desulfuromonadaceae bacterium]|nr:peptide chain release factor 2 [Geobacteraceae bacterium]